MKGFSRRVNARSPPATIVSFDYTNKEESIRADIWYDKNGTTKGKNRWEKKVSVLRGWARTISNDDFSDRHVIVRMKRDSWALARIHVILAIDRNAHTHSYALRSSAPTYRPIRHLLRSFNFNNAVHHPFNASYFFSVINKQTTF